MFNLFNAELSPKRCCGGDGKVPECVGKRETIPYATVSPPE